MLGWMDERHATEPSFQLQLCLKVQIMIEYLSACAQLQSRVDVFLKGTKRGTLSYMYWV